MLILSNPPHPLLTPSPPHRLTLSAAQRLVEVPAPTDEQLLAMLHKIIGRLMKLLTGGLSGVAPSPACAGSFSS